MFAIIKKIKKIYIYTYWISFIALLWVSSSRKWRKIEQKVIRR